MRLSMYWPEVEWHQSKQKNSIAATAPAPVPPRCALCARMQTCLACHAVCRLAQDDFNLGFRCCTARYQFQRRSSKAESWLPILTGLMSRARLNRSSIRSMVLCVECSPLQTVRNCNLASTCSGFVAGLRGGESDARRRQTQKTGERTTRTHPLQEQAVAVNPLFDNARQRKREWSKSCLLPQQIGRHRRGTQTSGVCGRRLSHSTRCQLAPLWHGRRCSSRAAPSESGSWTRDWTCARQDPNTIPTPFCLS